MIASANGREWPGIDEVVEAYELAQARDGRANLDDFLPSCDHPDRLAIICELIRVELEYAWRRGQPEQIDRYREQFPELFHDPAMEQAICFEESRLRRQATEASSLDFHLSDPGPQMQSVQPLPDHLRRAHQDSRASDQTTSRTETERAGRAYLAYRNANGDGALELESLFASWRIPQEQAELFRTLHRADPLAADSFAHAVTSLPKPGSRFLGFELQSELGRGAFGRVYLARQGDLADRPVALKVSADVASETHALAQLQHTNIVPIYSVHRSGPLQAVCMPYLGSTTLADVLNDIRQHETLPDSGAGLLSSRKTVATESSSPRSAVHSSSASAAAEATTPLTEAGSSAVGRVTAQVERLRELGYVQAVLWLAARVADGLAHAHERGILHRDLKPANILFSNDGEPLLLDFNLAADTKVRVHASAAMIGGTLPYMAPEHLAALGDASQTVDARSDVYSLGIILFELLTGRHPFPVHRGSVEEIVPRFIADKQGPPPLLRIWNPQITPATEAIVRKCLEREPSNRYQSARDLQDDVQRQLGDLPLRHAPEPSLRERFGKWARRHPRLTSTTTMAIAAFCLIAVVMTGASILVRKHAAVNSLLSLNSKIQEAYSLIGSADSDPATVDRGITVCDDVVRAYGETNDRSWLAGLAGTRLNAREVDELRGRIGELLLLYARNVSERAELTGGHERHARGIATAKRLNALSASFYPTEQAPRALWLHRAVLARLEGREDEAKKQLEAAAAHPVNGRLDEVWLAAEALGRGDVRHALPSIHRMPELARQDFTYWLLLGNGYAGLGNFAEAEYCFGECISIRPELPWPYFNRGLTYLDLKKPAQAYDDFDKFLSLQPEVAVAYINRALALLDQGRYREAIADVSRALERPDVPMRAWFIRARARALSGDRDGAARDRAEGLKREPADDLSWVARGVARLPGDPKGALADFDSALALNPRSRPAFQNKASVLSEYLGRTEDAVRVLDVALQHHPRSVNALAGRGVLLARLGRRESAHEDARAALNLDQQASTLYQVSGIYALTSKQNQNDRREAIRLMAESLRKDPTWLKIVPTDRDLDPIRDQPEFREVLGALAIVIRNESAMGSSNSNEKR